MSIGSDDVLPDFPTTITGRVINKKIQFARMSDWPKSEDHERQMITSHVDSYIREHAPELYRNDQHIAGHEIFKDALTPDVWIVRLYVLPIVRVK